MFGYVKTYRAMRGEGGLVLVFHSNDGTAQKWTLPPIHEDDDPAWLTRDIEKVREHIRCGWYVEVTA